MLLGTGQGAELALGHVVGVIPRGAKDGPASAGVEAALGDVAGFSGTWLAGLTVLGDYDDAHFID